jgi:hypothetical protein
MPHLRLVSFDWDHEVPRDEVAQQSVECFDRDLLVSHSSPSFSVHESFQPYAATDLDGTRTMFRLPPQGCQDRDALSGRAGPL